MIEPRSGGLSRRQVLQAALAIGVSASVPWTKRPAAFVHPGLLHTTPDFHRMKSRVDTAAQPWTASWQRLVANPHSAATWVARPQRTIVRGGPGENYPVLYNDIHAAYQNAVRWKIAGYRPHGDAARDILNAWSATLETITGTSDKYLAAGLYGYQLANVGEIMRGYPGFDLARFQRMMLEVFYPLNDSFLRDHNGNCVSHYWANWDLCTMNSVLAIGVLCDDRAKFDQAVTYFRSGAGNGSLGNVIPFVHPGGLAQWQEAGRDQGHTMLGVALLGAFCEMAWHQGLDLYSAEDNRFLQACEYIAKYNLGHEVPFTTYRWGFGKTCEQHEQTVISPDKRGNDRPIWALVHNHYVRRRGLSAPYTTEYVRRVAPEGGGGDYGSTSGGFDSFGFGTLTCTT